MKVMQADGFDEKRGMSIPPEVDCHLPAPSKTSSPHVPVGPRKPPRIFAPGGSRSKVLFTEHLEACDPGSLRSVGGRPGDALVPLPARVFMNKALPGSPMAVLRLGPRASWFCPPSPWNWTVPSAWMMKGCANDLAMISGGSGPDMSVPTSCFRGTPRAARRRRGRRAARTTGRAATGRAAADPACGDAAVRRHQHGQRLAGPKLPELPHADPWLEQPVVAVARAVEPVPLSIGVTS